MTDVRTASKELQDQILDTIRKSQEAVTDAIRTWAETVQSITPSLPVPPMPFADKLPKPGELVGNAYDSPEKLPAAQRNFAEAVTAATAPVLTAKNDTAAKKSASQAKCPHQAVRGGPRKPPAAHHHAHNRAASGSLSGAPASFASRPDRLRCEHAPGTPRSRYRRPPGLPK